MATSATREAVARAACARSSEPTRVRIFHQLFEGEGVKERSGFLGIRAIREFLSQWSWQRWESDASSTLVDSFSMLSTCHARSVISHHITFVTSVTGSSVHR